MVLLCVGLLVLFVVGLFASTLVPREGMVGNVNASLAQLQGEGVQFSVFAGDARYRVDNFTNAAMLNIALSNDSDNVVDASFGAAFLNEVETNPIEDLSLSLEGHGDNAHISSYARYWNGWLVVIRSLLMFLNLAQIRQVFFFILTCLITLCCCLTARAARSLAPGVAFAAAMAACVYPVACWSLSFWFSFVVALVSCCFVAWDASRGGGTPRIRFA